MCKLCLPLSENVKSQFIQKGILFKTTYIWICSKAFLRQCIIIKIIVKTMCPPGYHHNDFVAAHALRRMMYGYTLLVPMNIYI